MGEQISKNALPEGALEVLLNQYALIKDEVKERLKIAFSHIAYAGGIAVFGANAADKLKYSAYEYVFMPIMLIGFFALCWTAALNMRWIQHCGIHLRDIEDRINLHFGDIKILWWEEYSDSIAASRWFFIPKKPTKKYKSNTIKTT
jgi:hypothetical protein